MTGNVNELVNDALAAWAALVGLDAKSSTSMKKWDVRQHLESLNQSRELDPAGLTTFMMLRGLVDELCKDTTFSARDLLIAPAEVEQRLLPLRRLRALVEQPRVTEMIDEYIGRLETATVDYGMGKEAKAALDELLGSKYALGFLRRDALVSMERLAHHQFVQGPEEEVELKKNERVYEFLNMNSALAAVLGQGISGISMALIRDPEAEMTSYFAFLVRNGSTITVLTDHVEGPHPAYNRMTRRPDRRLEERAAQHWFPYQLMDLVRDEEDRLRIHRTSLVRYNVETVSLRKIAELEPEQFVWAVLMFDLIRERYGRGKRRLPALSYTGEMVTEPHALVGRETNLVRAGHYRPLELPAPTPGEVAAALEAPQWAWKSTRFNAWMEERYGDKVSPEYFSIVGTERKMLLEASSGDLLPPRKSDLGNDEVARVSLEALSPVTFGSRKKLQADRLWVARVNKMRVVQELAEAEYEAERERVYAWWRMACAKNAEWILEGLARGELLLPHHAPRSFEVGVATTTEANELRCYYSRAEWRKDYLFYYEEGGDAILGRWDRSRRWLCHDDGTAASVIGVIHPTCPGGLARLAGIEISNLPWALQHWHSEAPYYGNSILNRVEPSDWVLRNPWMPSPQRSNRMLVIACLSRRAFNTRKRALGLPRHVFSD